MMLIPMLPIKMPKQLMSAAADPVSPSCCSSIRFEPGVRTELLMIVDGNSARAKTIGSKSPSRATREPLHCDDEK